ncbi:MAG: HAMP domain-containing histidine kinase [Deltaproteobacteria bacterium]|nr:HAMP domain-containing histidine kinase [Deltaproteobacteria bacterium]
MKRLKLLITIFSLALCIPLAYFVLRTYRGLEQEEVATLSYFAEALFDEMDRMLAVMVQKEEGRAIDEYNFRPSPPGQSEDSGESPPSPLSKLSEHKYILGYFQNNPDGSFQTPLVGKGKKISPARVKIVAELKKANEIFNRKRVTVTDKVQPRPVEIAAESKAAPKPGFADKYLDKSRSQSTRQYLGQKEKRVEQITINQAANIAKPEQPQLKSSARVAAESVDRQDERYLSQDQVAGKAMAPKIGSFGSSFLEEAESDLQPASIADVDQPASYQVEVAPLRAVFLSDDQIFIYRRIMINKQIYRQGFVLRANAFLNYLAQTYFLAQPMAKFAGLRLSVIDQGRETATVESGIISQHPDFTIYRRFPSPFSFLKATLTCRQIPRYAGRSTLTIMLIVLAVIVLLGLFAIYQSTRTIVDLSERRSQFVSSVTHELKTPLTNIRMYIEMLEQGIARNPEREQEYFRILDSEGARLSRLINNVLELSKLEQKQRHIDLQSGTFEDVIAEVQAVMAEKIKQEGFTLSVDSGPIRPFKYDREVMIQVLINLIENSMKFGKSAPKRQIVIRTRREASGAQIMVSDTGPGIPRHALKKVFDDFYRVENSLTRTTRGTGIGLALVKKFVRLMGGSVTAANNDGPGCTFTISLPG